MHTDDCCQNIRILLVFSLFVHVNILPNTRARNLRIYKLIFCRVGTVFCRFLSALSDILSVGLGHVLVKWLNWNVDFE